MTFAINWIPLFHMWGSSLRNAKRHFKKKDKPVKEEAPVA